MNPPVVIYVKSDRAISQALYEARKDAKKGSKQEHRPRHKVDPMAVARSWLAGRLVEVPEKGYFLDRLPVGLDQVMQATNRELKAHGIEQIVTCERWRV